MTIYSLQVIKYLFETLSFNAKFGMYQLKLKLAEPRCIKLSSDIIVVGLLSSRGSTLLLLVVGNIRTMEPVFFEFVFVYFSAYSFLVDIELSQDLTSSV